MDSNDIVILNNLLQEDGDILRKFFDVSSLVNKDFNSEIREQAKEIFSKYSSKDFDIFMLQIYANINFAEQLKSDYRNSENVSIQTVPQRENCNNLIVNSMARQTINTCSFKNKKSKEEFNPLKFLKDKRKNQNYCFLEFQSDDDIENELDEINNSLNKKRLDLQARTDLRRMSEHLEALNEMYDYVILNIYYDKIH